MPWHHDEAGHRELQQHTSRVIGAGALEAGANLERRISAGPRSGRKYPRLPRRSSAPGQYPQRQSGALIRSLDVRPLENAKARYWVAWEWGFYDPAQSGKLAALELNPSNPRYRGGLRRNATDPRVHSQMRGAMSREAKR